ncbi:MAG: copper chaperone PCu(A)C [Gammaproteobacteria bacterium]|nr:copper chaperone PCu(A)C [Gammaproteobacteria bacterium]
MSLIKLLNRLLFVFLFSTCTVHAAESLKVINAWSPEAPPVAKVMAGYMTIDNLSNKDIKILSAKSNSFKRVEIHLTEMKDGMMRMTKQENLTIKANSHIELKQGGLHMMLMDKLEPIKSGSIIPVTLTLDNGKTININLVVKVNNEPEVMHHHHHH